MSRFFCCALRVLSFIFVVQILWSPIGVSACTGFRGSLIVCYIINIAGRCGTAVP